MSFGPTPEILVLGVFANGQQFTVLIPTVFTSSTNPPSIDSLAGYVTRVPSADAYHVVVNDALAVGLQFAHGLGIVNADLWFSGHPGGATLPADWDGQTSYWTQSIGAGVANGTVTFPGDSSPATVNRWGGEQETEYGTYELGPGPFPLTLVNHIGYDYAESDNPDGSADALDVFPELDGVWRGILTHTSAAGIVTECEPSQSGGLTLSDWYTDPVTGYDYPRDRYVFYELDLPATAAIGMDLIEALLR